jgi:hypothetical protein
MNLLSCSKIYRRHGYLKKKQYQSLQNRTIGTKFYGSRVKDLYFSVVYFFILKFHQFLKKISSRKLKNSVKKSKSDQFTQLKSVDVHLNHPH